MLFGEHAERRRHAALSDCRDCKPTFNSSDLPGKTLAVIDDREVPPLERKRTDGIAAGKTFLLVNGDGHRISLPEFKRGRAYPDHGLFKQQCPSLLGVP